MKYRYLLIDDKCAGWGADARFARRGGRTPTLVFGWTLLMGQRG